METYIPISQLNDFIFCPRSIYFHQLYQNYDSSFYYQKFQEAGKAVHETIDHRKYSTRKEILQGTSVYCERLGLAGKIDLYNVKTKVLTERKKRIVEIYEGYIFQVFAQYYALEEMGYPVEKITFYSFDDNKTYPVATPKEDEVMKNKFFEVIHKMQNFQLRDPFKINPQKCKNCIYCNLCDIP